jgi:hypothetical protein
LKSTDIVFAASWGDELALCLIDNDKVGLFQTCHLRSIAECMLPRRAETMFNQFNVDAHQDFVRSGH